MNWSFYRVRENWHKHPWVSRFLCWMGRHDYEFVRTCDNGAVLKCFYCEQAKLSGGEKFR